MDGLLLWEHLYQGQLLHTLAGHGHWVNTMALSKESLLRLGPFSASPASAPLTAAEARRRYTQDAHAGAASLVERLCSGSDDFTLHLWTPLVATTPVRRLVGHQALVNCVCFSHHGDVIASASFDKCVKVWDGYTGQLRYTLRGHVGPIYQLVFASDDRWVITCSKDATCKIWDLHTGKLKVDLPGHRDEVYAVDWAPSGDFVCSGGKDRVLKIWRY